MSHPERPCSEATRLESLWAGDFGDAYTDRNRDRYNPRESFWDTILSQFPVRNILEVGCNIGGNLQWLARRLDPKQVYGVDINHRTLKELRNRLPEVNALWAPARELPFRDNWFDMVFTVAVLIHQPDSTLPLVMAEIVRCTRRYVLCAEYYADEPTEVPYRGQRGALIKRDFGRLYQEIFPELRLRTQGFLSRQEGWDDHTYWVFEKPW